MAQNAFGVDIGTNSIKIYNKNMDTILNEKNVIAIQNKTKVYAIGDEAYDMYEKAPDNLIFKICRLYLSSLLKNPREQNMHFSRGIFVLQYLQILQKWKKELFQIWYILRK